MAFTDHSDVFAAVHENAINATIGQLMLQRPSLFNYATLLFTQALSTQFCLPINVPPGGLPPGQPLFTVEPPLPVLGAPRPLGLDWCLQLNNVSVDLHPENTLTLPPELGPLGPQRFALHLRACFGLACPGDELITSTAAVMEAAVAASILEAAAPPPPPPAGSTPSGGGGVQPALNPFVAATVDLAPLVKHELSLVASPLIQYFKPGITPVGSLCQKLHTALGVDDSKQQWRVFCDPQTIDFDLFDFADTVGDLFEQAFTAAIDALLPRGPLHDVIVAAIGSVADLLRTLLDIPDDLSEWLSDLFNVSLGVFNLILQFVADFFGKCVSFFQLDDPYPMFPATGDLAEVTIPIQHLTATVSDVELVVTADIGAVS
jgi:hypothetical protein